MKHYPFFSNKHNIILPWNMDILFSVGVFQTNCNTKLYYSQNIDWSEVPKVHLHLFSGTILADHCWRLEGVEGLDLFFRTTKENATVTSQLEKATRPQLSIPRLRLNKLSKTVGPSKVCPLSLDVAAENSGHCFGNFLW